MSCEQTPLLNRLAVENPTALGTSLWKAHLGTCMECRDARRGLERSLAVFRTLETEAASATVRGPEWETFSRTLERSRRRPWARLGVKVPLAAASLLVAVGTGVVMWPVAEQTRNPGAAKIVELRPDQQHRLQQALQNSLSDVTARSSAGAARRAPVQAVPVDTRFAVRGLEAQVAAPGTVLVRPTVAAVKPGQPMQPAPPNAADLEPSQAPRPTQPVASATSSDVASAAAGAKRSVRDGDERAPVMLFRSLQQRRERRPPIQVLPVISPFGSESGSSVFRSLLSPRPIR